LRPTTISHPTFPMNVNEIFTTIEGETSLTGLPMLFIRFTGCPLRCAFCDTTYAYEDGIDMSVEDLMARVREAQMDTVHLTGGEPLIQPELPELVDRLLADHRRVVIETSGARDITPYLKERVHIMLDIKTPGSGMDQHNLTANFSRMRAGIDEFKFVICNRSDWEWARNMVARHGLDAIGCVINVSPVFPDLPPATLAEWILKDRVSYRLNCQLHKFIWPDRSRGV